MKLKMVIPSTTDTLYVVDFATFKCGINCLYNVLSMVIQRKLYSMTACNEW